MTNKTYVLAKRYTADETLEFFRGIYKTPLWKNFQASIKEHWPDWGTREFGYRRPNVAVWPVVSYNPEPFEPVTAVTTEDDEAESFAGPSYDLIYNSNLHWFRVEWQYNNAMCDLAGVDGHVQKCEGGYTLLDHDKGSNTWAVEINDEICFQWELRNYDEEDVYHRDCYGWLYAHKDVWLMYILQPIVEAYLEDVLKVDYKEREALMTKWSEGIL